MASTDSSNAVQTAGTKVQSDSKRKGAATEAAALLEQARKQYRNFDRLASRSGGRLLRSTSVLKKNTPFMIPAPTKKSKKNSVSSQSYD